MREEQPSDDALVQRAKKGDLTAFDQLVARYYQRIYALAFELLNNAEDAADATQETFVKAFEQLHTFRGASAFTTWLYRIAVNTCRDFLRRSRPIPFSQLANDEKPDEFDLATLTEPHPEEVMAQRERSGLVWTALQQLPEEVRQILVLCDMQGFSYSEVSAILGIPEGTVKSRLHRARNAFKEVWQQMMQEQLSPTKRPKGGDVS